MSVRITPTIRALLAITLFLLATLALLLVSPNALRYGFPALAAICAAIVFSQSKTVYITFCFWLWFLSPLLRRLVDFRTEFVATSPLLLAPFLAASVSGIVLIRHLRTLTQRQAVPFACAFAGILFGTVYGLTRYAPIDVARGLINWLAPVLFAFFLFVARARLAEYRATITRSLIWGTLLLSIYGILQFLLLPPWDEAWMRGLNNGAFGEPFPLRIRVFSTMNAPATFASYVMAGVLLAFAVLIETRDRRTPSKDSPAPGSPTPHSPALRFASLFCAPFGLLAFILTTSRALWLGLVAGILYMAFALPGKARLRVIGTIFATLLLAAAATQAPGIHEVVSARLKSFQSGTSDISASARINGYASALAHLATEPLGEGMGSTDTDHATDGSDDRLGPHDSTLLEFLYALGGPGTFIYAIGLAAGLVAIFFGKSRATVTTVIATDPVSVAICATIFAFFAQSLLTSILVGVPGFLVWTFLALALSAKSVTGQKMTTKVS